MTSPSITTDPQNAYSTLNSPSVTTDLHNAYSGTFVASPRLGAGIPSGTTAALRSQRPREQRQHRDSLRAPQCQTLERHLDLEQLNNKLNSQDTNKSITNSETMRCLLLTRVDEDSGGQNRDRPMHRSIEYKRACCIPIQVPDQYFETYSRILEDP